MVIVELFKRAYSSTKCIIDYAELYRQIFVTLVFGLGLNFVHLKKYLDATASDVLNNQEKCCKVKIF